MSYNEGYKKRLFPLRIGSGSHFMPSERNWPLPLFCRTRKACRGLLSRRTSPVNLIFLYGPEYLLERFNNGGSLWESKLRDYRKRLQSESLLRGRETRSQNLYVVQSRRRPSCSNQRVQIFVGVPL